jgi:hypothetical protein
MHLDMPPEYPSGSPHSSPFQSICVKRLDSWTTIVLEAFSLRKIHGNCVRRGRERGSSGYPSFVTTMSAVLIEKDVVLTHTGSTQNTPQTLQVLTQFDFFYILAQFL